MNISKNADNANNPANANANPNANVNIEVEDLEATPAEGANISGGRAARTP